MENHIFNSFQFQRQTGSSLASFSPTKNIKSEREKEINKLPSIHELLPENQLNVSNELLQPVQIDSVNFGSGPDSKFSVTSYRSSLMSLEQNFPLNPKAPKKTGIPQFFHAVIKNHLIQTKNSLQENKQLLQTESKSQKKDALNTQDFLLFYQKSLQNNEISQKTAKKVKLNRSICKSKVNTTQRSRSKTIPGHPLEGSKLEVDEVMSEIREILKTKGFTFDSHKDILISREQLVEIFEQLVFRNKQSQITHKKSHQRSGNCSWRELLDQIFINKQD